MNRGAWTGLVAALCALPACGSSSLVSSSPDGAVDSMTAGMCGADVPTGQACNTLTASGPSVAIACATGSMPTGKGGTIAEGRYNLTQTTYYNFSNCQTLSLTETIDLSGGCLQLVSGMPFPVTLSGTFTVSGNTITTTETCMNIMPSTATVTPDAPTKTFTATPTTFTLYSQNSAAGNPNPDSVAVFTKQ